MSMNGQGRYGLTHSHDPVASYRIPSRAVIELRIARVMASAKRAKKHKDIAALIRLDQRHKRLLAELRRAI